MNPALQREESEKVSPGEVWAVAGGKGGTGKSFVASSVGTSLAGQGKRVVLVDADQGGANLHSFIGMDRPKNSLSDFFEKKIPLNDLVEDTGLANLGLVTGDLHSPDSDNINHMQKLKLFRHIRSIDADYVILDLGAGSRINTIDTFLLADRMMMVISPEVTSIENMYHFIKNVLFRKIRFALKANGWDDVVQETWKKRDIYGFKNIRELIDYLSGISNEVRDILSGEIEGFRVNIVLNQVRVNQDITVGLSVQSVLKSYLGIKCNYVGYVGYDDAVWSCVRKREPFMHVYPSSHCALEIRRIADNIVAGRQLKIVNNC